MSGVNSSLRKTSSSLKDIDKLLKLDPSNTELLQQKQRLLAESIDNTEKKLTTLKEASRQAQEQLEKGNLGQDKYDALQREIIDTEKNLESLKTAAADTASALDTNSKGFQNFGDAANKASGQISGVSKAAGTLAGAALATVPATSELRRDLSFLELNAERAGVGVDKAKEAFKTFNTVSGETDSSVEAVSNLLAAGFTESNLQKAVEGVSGAMARFPDTLKIESLSDSIQETVATGKSIGQFGEYLDRVGIGAANFDAELANCSTQAERTDLVLQALADGGAQESYDAWSKNNKELVANEEAMTEMQTAVGDLATSLSPVVTAVVKFATSMLNAFNSLPKPIQVLIGSLVGLVAAASPVLKIAGTLSGHFGKLKVVIAAVKPAITAASAAIGGISLPILIAVAAIVSLIAIFKTLWETNENFRTTITTAWNTIKTTISNVVNQIKAIVQAFIDLVSAIWNQWGASITASVSTTWNMIKTIISGALTVIQNVIKLITSIINGDWKSAWEAAKNIISTILNTIKTLVKTAFNGVVSSIKSIGSKIGSAVRSAFSSAIDYITSLPGKAVGWGKDFINGLKDGILSGVDKIVSAVKGIGDKIRSFLHFSRPDEGPLRDYETWMPDFMAGLSKGIKQNEYLVTDAIAGLSAQMAAGFAAPQNPQTFDYSQIYRAMQSAVGGLQLKLVIDGRDFGRVLRGLGVEMT